MSQPDHGPVPPAGEADAADPAEALADVWQLLDSLPAAAASADMLATTIEMAAVTGAGGVAAAGGGRTAAAANAGPSGGGRMMLTRWLPAAAVVLASLAIGLAAGRATAPNPELAVLASLPIAQHVDLLREAGSVAFLEEVARRGYPAPRRPPPAQSSAAARADMEEFDTAIAALRKAAPTDAAGSDVLASRRQEVLGLPDAKRRQLEKSVESYQRLSAADRRELAAVGRALADPDRGKLLEAARLWHLWIQLRDPADRRDVIDLGTADRLEWLDRWTRLDSRNDLRQEVRDNVRQYLEREFENRGRRPGEFRPGPPEPGRDEPPRSFRPRGGPGGPNGPGGPGFGPGGGFGRRPEPPPRPRDPDREPPDAADAVSDRPPPPRETPAPPR